MEPDEVRARTEAIIREWVLRRQPRVIEGRDASGEKRTLYALDRYFSAESKAVKDKEGVILATITTKARDRMGDIVEPAGAELADYAANPVVMFAHDYWGLPIGKGQNLKVQKTKIQAEVHFDMDDPFAAEVYGKYQRGFMNAWSIGFIPLEIERMEGKEGEFLGYHIKRWELLEFSAVPVPANAQALTVAVKSGEVKISRRLAAAFGLKDLPPEEAEETPPPPKEPETPSGPELEPESEFCPDCKHPVPPDSTHEGVVCTECGAELVWDDEGETKGYIVIEPMGSTPEAEVREVAVPVSIGFVEALLKESDDIPPDATIVGLNYDEGEVLTVTLASETFELVQEGADRPVMVPVFKRKGDVTQKMLKDMLQELTEMKEGRVLSRKNRELIQTSVDVMGEATSALIELLDATNDSKDDDEDDDDDKGITPPKPKAITEPTVDSEAIVGAVLAALQKSDLLTGTLNEKVQRIVAETLRKRRGQV